jgi:signal transduction histidine kinase/ligand-binding sensor domain-containing protein
VPPSPFRILLLLALLACAHPGAASEPAITWLDRAWQTDDGLPDNGVSGVVQTGDGFVWVATLGGLVRFDGAAFQEFSPQAVPGIPNRVVRSMHQDRQGRIWLGMDRGPLLCMWPDGAAAYTNGNGLPDLKIVSFAEDSFGTVWLGYQDGTVSRVHADRVERVGRAANGPCFLVPDGDGRLWFGSGRRVGRVENGKFQTLFRVEHSPVCIGARRAGGIWICAGGRLWSAEESGPMVPSARLPGVAESAEVSALLEDSTGSLWIGTLTGGLFRRSEDGIESVATSHREIWCLTEDREGNIWAGTGGGGLNRLRPRPLDLVTVNDGLPFENIRSASEDASGRLWVATQNGLVAHEEGGGWKTLGEADGWTGEHARTVAGDKEGGVWIGTRDRGLYRLRNGRFTRWTATNGLGSDAVRSLLPASNGDLWIAIDAPTGLRRMRGETLEVCELPQRVRALRAMTEDASGTVWVGSAEGVLFRVRNGRAERETAIDRSREHSIRSLLATPDGSLWIGYAGNGLGRLKDGRFDRIDLARGLHDDFVSQMAADDHGRLWIAGNRGVFQVRLQELAEALAKPDATVRSIVFGRGEGLPNLQGTFDFYPNSVHRRDGSLWFPTRTGLAVARPDHIRDNPDPPRVLIDRVTVDGRTLGLYDSRLPVRALARPDAVDLRHASTLPALPPDHRKVDIDFTSLSYWAPANVHFRYQLRGVDVDWVEARAARAATYPRLPAGHYEFVVSACNNAGVWNERGAMVAFDVLPFFWQTWWFRAGVLLAFTSSIIAIVRYVSFRRLRRDMVRLEEQASLHRERARIAKDIHDDLGANLTQIALLGELAQQDRSAPDKAGRRIETISLTARQAIKSLDEIVWAVNPRNDTLPHLVDYASQFALDYLTVAGIRCRLDLPDDIPQREVSTDVRHNLFLVVKEALNNIVKHARATEVRLRMTLAEDGLRFVVADNGCGFDRPPDAAGADGLRNMRQRVADVGGRCTIESRSGEGTTVSFDIPWPRSRDESQ